MGIVRRATFLYLLLLLVLAACQSQPAVTFPAATPVGDPIEVGDLAVATGQTVYVPAYSEVPFAAGDLVAVMSDPDQLAAFRQIAGDPA
jgi:hypothetical protein